MRERHKHFMGVVMVAAILTGFALSFVLR